MSDYIMSFHVGGGGGGGAIGKYTGGGVPWHITRGLLGAGTAEKGVLCASTTLKRRISKLGLRCGHNQKKVGIRN